MAGGTLKLGIDPRVGPPPVDTWVGFDPDIHSVTIEQQDMPPVAHPAGGTVQRQYVEMSIAPKDRGGAISYHQGTWEGYASLRLPGPSSTSSPRLKGQEDAGGLAVLRLEDTNQDGTPAHTDIVSTTDQSIFTRALIPPPDPLLPSRSFGGVAQPGRALRSQRRSRGFKSHHLHKCGVARHRGHVSQLRQLSDNVEPPRSRVMPWGTFDGRGADRTRRSTPYASRLRPATAQTCASQTSGSVVKLTTDPSSYATTAVRPSFGAGVATVDRMLVRPG